VPIYALNQVADERCEWLVPGMLADKVAALLKSLPQRPRSRLVPLPSAAADFCKEAAFGECSLVDALLAWVRSRTQLPVQRQDFKLEMLPPYLSMNLRVVDEHGRQLAMGRHLAALKAQWGAQARSAFQALAGLKLGSPGGTEEAPVRAAVPAGAAQAGAVKGPAAVSVAPSQGRGREPGGLAGAQTARPGPGAPGLGPAGSGGYGVAAVIAPSTPSPPGPVAHTAWTFGELPELMEIRKAGQTLIGFPALIDRATHVEIEVFDEPDVAAQRHRAGLRRLVALQIREPLKALERQIPELQKMAALYLPLGTLEELRGQIIDLALDRAFLAEPLPLDATAFSRRVEEGRTRLVLIAQEVARLTLALLTEHAAATRKLKDSRPPREVADDVQAQLQRLCGKRFLATTPWAALQHLPRYLKAVVLRLDKLRADPARDASRMAELRPLEQRWLRRQAELKGAADARLEEYRWLLEELRVSLFAQELRTPQPVSVKRLDKVWAQIQG
jgi:ATP-dependent helicase HrpA